MEIGLPGIDGFKVLRRLRARESDLPLLLLTGRSAIDDRVHGLELGADDCLVKPFAASELVARLKALSRRSGPKPVELRLGGLSPDLSSKRVRVNGEVTKLRPSEWDTLQYLMWHAACVVTRENILNAVLPSDKEITHNAVEVNISRIRSKIADAGVMIRTIRSAGYSLEKVTS